MLPKAICKFSAIPIKIQQHFFTEIEQKILKFAWNYKRIQTVKAIMIKGKKNKTKICVFQDLKFYYKAMIIRTVQYWNNDKHRAKK